MKLTEEQKEKISVLIEESLKHVTLLHIKDEDGFGFPLLDFLSTSETCSTGEEEIENIVTQICYDMDEWDI